MVRFNVKTLQMWGICISLSLCAPVWVCVCVCVNEWESMCVHAIHSGKIVKNLGKFQWNFENIHREWKKAEGNIFSIDTSLRWNWRVESYEYQMANYRWCLISALARSNGWGAREKPFSTREPRLSRTERKKEISSESPWHNERLDLECLALFALGECPWIVHSLMWVAVNRFISWEIRNRFEMHSILVARWINCRLRMGFWLLSERSVVAIRFHRCLQQHSKTHSIIAS